LLSLMPFALAWAWWRARPKVRTGGVLLALAVMLLTVLPWMVRNHSVMGRWIFVRDNFWAELRFGNAEPSRGIWLGWMNPTINDLELARYREVGELQYIAEKRTAVLEFIRRRPLFFLDLCLRRFFFFWCNIPSNWEEDLSPHEVLRDQWWVICFSALAWVGMIRMLQRRAPAPPGLGWLLAPALLVYPCLYYIASADPRYRHPIEPVMLVLAASAVAAALQHGPSSVTARRRPAAL
jgi:4-amino-4-deoxy-L-arabinose transferase-like glycosyltransferase